MIEYTFYKYKEHSLTYSSGELNDLPEDIVSTLKEWQVSYADKVVIATLNQSIIGFFRYDLGFKRPWLYAAGTYVIPEYRNQNIAFNLWEKAIANESPNKILAHVASDGGLKLVSKIRRCYPKIIMDISLDKKMLVA